MKRDKIENGHDKPKVIVYFHNLSYDAAFILKTKLSINSMIRPEGSMIQFKVFRYGYEIIFRDSMRIFGPTKLSELPKMFLTK